MHNNKNIKVGEALLQQYQDAFGECDLECDLTDAIAALLHYAHSKFLDFDDLADRAVRHVESETEMCSDCQQEHDRDLSCDFVEHQVREGNNLAI